MAKKKKYKYVIIGAGFSGLTTAYELSKKYPEEVLLIEKYEGVGGLSRTINNNEGQFDLGSHRIHINPRKNAFSLIKDVAGDILVKNKRKGRLRIKNSYVNYPITSVQMFFGIGIIESFLCGISLIKSHIKYKFFEKKSDMNDLDYESYLIRKAGLRAYRLFYEPYARKVWGGDPKMISTTAVKKRISMVNPTRFLLDIMGHFIKKIDRGNYFYYLKGGIGLFGDRLRERIINNGSEVLTGIDDFHIDLNNGNRSLNLMVNDVQERVEFETLVSTIPLDDTVHKSGMPDDIIKKADAICWRGLRFVFLRIEGAPLKLGETFYFPELKYIFGRASIPKRFSENMQPDDGTTVFTCEVPCSVGDGIWSMTDEEMFNLCWRGLKEAGLISKDQKIISQRSFIFSLPKVYPIYLRGWKENLNNILHYIAEKYPFIYISGRSGFFMHCNLDHAIDIGLFMAQHLLEGKPPLEWYDKINFFHNMKLRD